MLGRVTWAIAPTVRGRVSREHVRRLAHDIRTLLRRAAPPRAGVELWICDDAQMSALHERHFGYPKPTDVLSFPAADEPVLAELDGESPSLGQIVVNADAVARQAGVLGMPGMPGWFGEARSLCIHAVAHLLGHDHATPGDARAMLRAERRLGRALRVGVARPYGGPG